jgi:DNA-binding NarL/FixJ family response regulator
MTDDKPVRILIVDDQRLMRDGLASLLGLHETLEIVGLASNGDEALLQIEQLRPDVVLMDVRMPVMDGVRATQISRRQYPDCQILMLTTFDDEEYIIEALKAGACGYLLKDLPANDLAQAILAAHHGIHQLDPQISAKLIAALRDNNPSVASAITDRLDLTTREMDVLRLIAQGASNREISEALVVSQGTVKNHISNILSRLGLRDRTQAALFAREKGFL